MKITLKNGKYFVETGTFMSDGTYQSGFCTLEGRVLRFAGQFNRLPFKVTLGPVAYALVLDLRDGEFVAFTPDGTPKVTTGKLASLEEKIDQSLTPRPDSREVYDGGNSEVCEIGDGMWVPVNKALLSELDKAIARL